MYINDVHILVYVSFAILGVIIAGFINWCNDRMVENKKIFSKDMLDKTKRKKLNYILIIVMVVLYVAIVYFFGIHKGLYENLNLIKFVLLIPMLISALMIDYKLQIIPNRLNLTMFEIGLFFTFLYGIENVNMAIDMLLGMVVGGGIFLIITLLGGIIAGKEAMGFGDVKLMGALGLYFGLSGIILISLIAFLLGAIISIILLSAKIKNSSEYIPFGPFIVIASLIVLFVPFEILVTILLKIFTLGMYRG